MFSTCPFVRPSVCCQSRENDNFETNETDFDANWHKCTGTHDTINFGSQLRESGDQISRSHKAEVRFRELTEVLLSIP